MLEKTCNGLRVIFLSVGVLLVNVDADCGVPFPLTYQLNSRLDFKTKLSFLEISRLYLNELVCFMFSQFFQLGQPDNDNVPAEKDYEIRDLISTLFEKALVKKNWAIVRQTAGNDNFCHQIDNSKLPPIHSYFSPKCSN